MSAAVDQSARPMMQADWDQMLADHGDIASAERDAAILDLAVNNYPWSDGEIEMGSPGDEPGAMVSEGEDNGAYVRAWVWVSFEGTPLDKDPS